MSGLSFVNGSFSAQSNVSASDPLLFLTKSLLQSLGYTDLTESTHHQERLEAQAQQKLKAALEAYSLDQNPSNRNQLIDILNNKVKELRTEYNHAVEQQRHYEEQVQADASNLKEMPAKSYLTQASYYGSRAIKNFFGSDAEQLAEKYSKVAADRLAKINAVSGYLKKLKKYASSDFSLDVNGYKETEANSHRLLLSNSAGCSSSDLNYGYSPLEILQTSFHTPAKLNINTSNNNNPSAAGFYDNNFIMVWDGENAGSGKDIYAIKCPSSPDDECVNDPWRVNMNIIGTQTYPVIASFSNNQFVVTWHGDSTGDQDVYANCFLPNNTAVSPEFLVNDNLAGSQYFPAVSVLGTSFAITWTSDYGSESAVYAKFFTTDMTNGGFNCTPVSQDVRVDSYAGHLIDTGVSIAAFKG